MGTLIGNCPYLSFLINIKWVKAYIAVFISYIQAFPDGKSPQFLENFSRGGRVRAGQGVAGGLPRGRGVQKDHPLGLQEPCQAPHKRQVKSKKFRLI